ncbi:HNH endonuclease [Sulfitobacter sp. OXR-159]|uniref:HNH endonuclease n=1 Tax=Sulfitobacter sp. OXR-159 TaxID=3100174 RepID=UPI002AC9755C|nr:HNH endonuclease [Sulfitobacter sp. OXR-159]WPZ30710.1 HNH endonuclease [Sulfitobacter sp. OXR-159]WPZ30811.1 HNH endonuclease [Sulfitobacter sp. OXR-159]
MSQLCKIDEVAEELGVPKASLRTAAENHGFLVRIGSAIRLERDRLPELAEAVEAHIQSENPVKIETKSSRERAERAAFWLKNIKNLPRDAPPNRYLSAAKRREIFERDGPTCAYFKNTEGPFAIDHIYPFSKGGGNEAHNLTVACQTCNSSKGNKLLKDWKPELST